MYIYIYILSQKLSKLQTENFQTLRNVRYTSLWDKEFLACFTIRVTIPKHLVTTCT